MNNKNEGTAVWVFLNSEGKGLAVELHKGPTGQVMCPMSVKYVAYGIYDVTNSRTVKWKLGSNIPSPAQMATIQLLAANPKGQFLRGRLKLTDELVQAFTGKPVERDEQTMWLRVALLDPNTGVVFPEHLPLLDSYRFQEDDQKLVDALLKKNKETA